MPPDDPASTDGRNNRPAEEGPAEAILPLVYDELRRLAKRRLRDERPDHTLQATALANEVYLKLSRRSRPPWRSRDDFMAAAAQAVRRILVDHARQRKAAKRGGGHAVLTLDTSLLAPAGDDVDLVALDEALERLAAAEPEKARVVELRFFGEMPEAQIAHVLGVTERTVRRHWEYARAWLYRELAPDDGGAE